MYYSFKYPSVSQDQFYFGQSGGLIASHQTLQLSKLKLLEYFYFFDECLDPELYSLLYVNTDSIILALVDPEGKLENCIRSGIDKEEFSSVCRKWINASSRRRTRPEEEKRRERNRSLRKIGIAEEIHGSELLFFQSEFEIGYYRGDEE